MNGCSARRPLLTCIMCMAPSASMHVRVYPRSLDDLHKSSDYHYSRVQLHMASFHHTAEPPPLATGPHSFLDLSILIDLCQKFSLYSIHLNMWCSTATASGPKRISLFCNGENFQLCCSFLMATHKRASALLGLQCLEATLLPS
jgi:hypothetical protein